MPLPKRRSRTRNITLACKREDNETLTIEVDPSIRRIVGKDFQYFISESGCIVRKFGRLNVDKWSHLQAKYRDNLYKTVTDDFQFENNIASKTAINRQLNILYRNHRYRLHKYFLTFETKEEAIQHVPEGVSIKDWTWICNYFGSEEFKKISDRNKVNRAKNETHTTVGTKSLARVVEEKKKKEGVELSEIEVFEISRTSKKT
ncbi:uncharacterized protein [Coffea arabica]|uniref:Uncharacterized protein n=1 Tax=Coffea arabica TaxID=13443 RepID=A0ABM4UBP5_COFAR